MIGLSLNLNNKLNIFSNSTGITNYELLKDKNKSQPSENKNKEIFIIEMTPQEYLDFVHKGFEYSDNREYSKFQPEEYKIKRIKEEYIEQNKLLDIPFIYEIYTKNFNKDKEVYSFGQEGRHRSIISLELNIEKIKVAYVRSKNMISNIGLDNFLKIKNINKPSSTFIYINQNKNRIIENIKNKFNFMDFSIDIERNLNSFGSIEKNIIYISEINTNIHEIDNNIYNLYGELLFDYLIENNISFDIFVDTLKENFSEYINSNKIKKIYEYLPDEYNLEFKENYEIENLFEKVETMIIKKDFSKIIEKSLMNEDLYEDEITLLNKVNSLNINQEALTVLPNIVIKKDKKEIDLNF